MRLKHLPLIGLLLFIISVAIIPGIFATWKYSTSGPQDKDLSFNVPIVDYNWNGVVYITDVVQSSGDGKGVSIACNATTLSSKVELLSGKNSNAELKITVYNSSDEIYAFNAVKYTVENYDNTDIVFEHPNITHGDTIDAKSYKEFNVVFAYKSGVTPSNRQLLSTLNFEFMPLDELPKEEEIAVSGALGQFKAILNNETISNSLSQLTTQMDDYDANDRHDNSYIGNVSGAAQEDILLLENLFQDNLTLVIDGVETNVTILIKRENLDGNSTTGDSQGREMTIYMTTDDLRQTGSWFSPSKAPVYAAVFTSDDDGENWYQLGEMFEGTATIKQYNGMPGSGSFDTDTWKSTNGKTIKQLI